MFNFKFWARGQIFFFLRGIYERFIGCPAVCKKLVQSACPYNATKVMMFHFTCYNSTSYYDDSQTIFRKTVVQTLSPDIIDRLCFFFYTMNPHTNTNHVLKVTAVSFFYLPEGVRARVANDSVISYFDVEL